MGQQGVAGMSNWANFGGALFNTSDATHGSRACRMKHPLRPAPGWLVRCRLLRGCWRRSTRQQHKGGAAGGAHGSNAQVLGRAGGLAGRLWAAEQLQTEVRTGHS